MSVRLLTKKSEYEIKKNLDANKYVRYNARYFISCERKQQNISIRIQSGASAQYSVQTKWTGYISDGALELKKRITFNQVIMIFFVMALVICANVPVLVWLMIGIQGLSQGNIIGVIDIRVLLVLFLIEGISVAAIWWFKRMYYKKPAEVLRNFLEQNIL